jgi:hypothetical protein
VDEARSLERLKDWVRSYLLGKLGQQSDLFSMPTMEGSVA